MATRYTAGMPRDLNRSPFPGMDPYLERYWGDVHHGLCTYCRDVLRKGLPKGLVARLDERTTIELGYEEQRGVIPDVRVIQHSGSSGRTAVLAPVDEPLIVENEIEITEGFVQVIDILDNNQVVTVIEFASPTNKIASPGREKYRKKRHELLEGGVSIVEIDLIRAGTWNLQASELAVTSRRPGLYYVSFTRGWAPNQSGVYSIGLRDVLPRIRVPLRKTDADASLDLQSLINQVYENGGYGETLDYSNPPVPPLSKPDQEWASEWLKDALK